MTKPPEDKDFDLDAPTRLRALSGAGKLVGLVLGQRYKIVEVIGEGGIGIVYRARQLAVDRDVAIKILKKQFANDELAVRRFENEATAIGRLRHPNTLRLYDCQRTPAGELYIVTELLSGSPLQDVLTQQGRLPIERALRTFDEVCRSLAEAHAAGIVHRDLKPANIFLDRIGSEDVVKVLDFGIAKILQGSGGLTRAGAVPGTPHYMSPEQAASQRVDHRADIYSLGVILYQMIAGRPPFDGASVVDILRRHITEPPPTFATTAPDAGVPEELERFVFWLLEKAPEDRPQSADELRRHLPRLLAIAAPVQPLALPARTEHASDGRPSGWPMWAATIGLAGVVIGVAIGYASTNREIVILPRNEAKSAPLVAGPVAPAVAPPLVPAPISASSSTVALETAKAEPEPEPEPERRREPKKKRRASKRR